MNLFQSQQKTCVAVCTPFPTKNGPYGPVLEPISPNWHRARTAMQLPTNINTAELSMNGLEVGDARSKAARVCLDMPSKPEFLLFLDYDVLLPPDTLTKLLFRAKCFPDYDIYCGVYCCKWQEIPDPLIYGEHGLLAGAVPQRSGVRSVRMAAERLGVDC